MKKKRKKFAEEEKVAFDSADAHRRTGGGPLYKRSTEAKQKKWGGAGGISGFES